jgi:hypothetical protein
MEIDFGVSDVEAAGIKELQAVCATADAHFYLNCWRIVALNAYRIATAIDHEQLHQFIKDQNCSINRTGTGLYFGDAVESVTLGWYANGRDQFEHIDERVYGGKHWGKVKTDTERILDLTGQSKENAEHFPAPFFNGTHMVVGNSLWEITQRTHRQLFGRSVSLRE